MFFIALRNRRGIDRSASATCCSNSFLVTRSLRSLVVARPPDDQPEIVAVITDGALIAERFRPADSAAVEDEGIRRSRPARLGRGGAQLLAHDLGLVVRRRAVTA